MENSFEPRPEIDKIVLDNLSSLDGFLAIAYGNMPDEERGNIEVYAVFVEKGQLDRGAFKERYDEAIRDIRNISERNPWIFIFESDESSLEKSLGAWSRRVDSL